MPEGKLMNCKLRFAVDVDSRDPKPYYCYCEWEREAADAVKLGFQTLCLREFLHHHPLPLKLYMYLTKNTDYLLRYAPHLVI